MNMNREELSKKLNEESFDSHLYSLYGDLLPDRIIIYENYNIWEIFYLDDRGGRHMITICHSENNACAFLYNYLKENVLREASKYFSHQPEYLTHTTKLIKKIELLENTTQIWFDSIVKKEKKLPYFIRTIIFEIECTEIKDKFIIRFYGSKRIQQSNGNVVFTVDFVPFHDYMFVKWTHKQLDLENDFSNILHKYVLDDKNAVYGDFFKDRILCVGFRNNIHMLQAEQ